MRVPESDPIRDPPTWPYPSRVIAWVSFGRRFSRGIIIAYRAETARSRFAEWFQDLDVDRFDRYGFEELVAEFGAVFLLAFW